MKNQAIRKKHKKHRFINGTKGAISLFLVVLMLPFVQIASALLTAEKYNAAIAILDEIMDSALCSTLAEHDTYLSDRFGLLATTQEKEQKGIFDTYLNHNLDVLPGTFEVPSVTTVTGVLPISDHAVLRAQIDEYAKYNSPLLLMNQFLNLAELMKSLEKSLNINNLFGTINSGVSACSSIVDYGKEVDALKELSDEIYDLIDDYDTAHSDFQSAVSTLVSAYVRLDSLEQSLEAAEAAAENSTDPEFDNSDEIASLQDEIADLEEDIADYKTDVTDAQSAYSSLHQTLIEKITSYNTSMEKALESLNKVASNLVNTATGALATAKENEDRQNKERLSEVEKELREISKNAGRDKYLDPYYGQLLNEKAELDTAISTYKVEKYTYEGIKKLGEGAGADYQQNQAAYDPNVAKQLVEDLRVQKAKVDSFSVSSVDMDTPPLTGYHFKIEGIMTSEDLGALTLAFETYANDTKTALASFWEGIEDMVSSMLKLDLVYAPELCSLIDSEFFMENYGIDIEREDAANPLVTFINAVCGFLTAVMDFVLDISTGKFWEWYDDLKDLLEKGKALVNALLGLLESLGNFLISFGTGDVLSNLWYTYYLVFNLPCRTDYSSGKAMTGYSFSEVEFENHSQETVELPIIQDIVSLISLAFTDREANSKIFSGAELEYMLVGSNDEIKNQAVTFGMLYVFRLLCNIPIVTSPEVTALAAGPQAPVVYILYMLIEPFIDMVLLVNGTEIGFLKSTPYLSVSGIYPLIEEVCEMAASKIDEKELQESFGKILGYEGEIPEIDEPTYVDELLEFSYKEYIFFVMAVFSNEENELELYKNIIQMEGLAYNSNHRFCDFDVNKAYTSIEASVDVKVKEFMPQLLSGDLYNAKRTRQRGY